MFKRLFCTCIIFGAAALAPPLHAQSANCMPREDLIKRLQGEFTEQISGGGLQNPQQLLEVWSSDTTGSFTVFVTRASGQSCVIATGTHWKTIAPEKDRGVAG